MSAHVDRMMTVATPSRSYPVYGGHAPAAALSDLWRPEWRQAAVIGDETTTRLFGPSLVEALASSCSKVDLFDFPPGEAHKTRATKERLEDALLQGGFDRSCCVVAVGGGIALDVAGYVAATYLRGVPWVSVATTLLAQVDASIGGKTGVNTPHGKNLVGAFHQPHAVFLDLGALDSLPVVELRNGLAEAVKHAFVADPALFASLESWAEEGGARPLPEALLQRCIGIKARIVAEDEGESGVRRILNFGHTVAHGLEAATGHALPHGAAVSVGMVLESQLAETVCGFPEAHGLRLRELLATLGLPVTTDVPFSTVRRYLERDKKNLDGAVRFSLPLALGRVEPGDGSWAVPVPLEALESAWDASS